MANKIRLSQCPVGATFKFQNVAYIKVECENMYQPNAIRVNNKKPTRLHGSRLVEVLNNE